MLGLATASLFSSVQTVSADQTKEAEKKWDIDTATLFYSDSGSRVIALEPVINAKRTFADR